MNAFEPVDSTPPKSRGGRLALRLLVLAPLVLAAFWAGSLLRPGNDSPGPGSDESRPVDRGEARLATAAQPRLADNRPSDSLWEIERATVELFRTASPSVVYITTLQNVRRRFTNEIFQRESGAGSGFVWDMQGHIVTNYHVVARRGPPAAVDRRRPPQVAQVTLFDQTVLMTQTVVGIAPEKDLAVLKVDAPRGLDLQPLPIGDLRQLSKSVSGSSRSATPSASTTP